MSWESFGNWLGVSLGGRETEAETVRRKGAQRYDPLGLITLASGIAIVKNLLNLDEKTNTGSQIDLENK